MTLTETLLCEMSRTHSAALVLRQGEHPYVVTPDETVYLPHTTLTPDVFERVLGQLLPPDGTDALEEIGEVRYELEAPRALAHTHFTIFAGLGPEGYWARIHREEDIITASRGRRPSR